MLLLELEGRQVVQSAVRPDGVEVTAPSFDDDLCFGARAEPLDAQALVAELAVEAFVVGVLPGLARIDQGRADAAMGEPLEDCQADELRSVVRAQEERSAVLADEASEHLDQPLGADVACHVDGQALPGELVDDGQAFELLAIGTRVEDEVVGPDEVRTDGWQRT